MLIPETQSGHHVSAPERLPPNLDDDICQLQTQQQQKWAKTKTQQIQAPAVDTGNLNARGAPETVGVRLSQG